MDRKKEKISFFKSAKGRIISASVIVIVLIILVLNVVTIGSFKRSILNRTQDYMKDMAEAYGKTLEKEDNGQVPDASSLEALFKGVGVEGLSSSYAYIVSSDGTMLYHPTAEKIGKSVENSVILGLVKDISAGKIPDDRNDVAEYMFNGAKKYASYYIASDGSFIVVISADYSDVMSEVNSTLVSVTILGVVIGLAGLFVLIFILSRSLRVVKELSSYVDKMANLDFTGDDVSEKLAKRPDEFGVMARSILNLETKLIDVISGIRAQSDKLHKSSAGMYKDISDMNETTNQVDVAVNEIAQGATSQAGQTQTASENVIMIGNMIESTNEQVESLDAANTRMKESQNTAVQILGELGDTNDRTKESIEQIAEQTKTTNESA
ncbi:MAG: hypothetical protein ACI4CS_08745, partial [Candidatus Weimeria sp.]